MPGHKLFAFVGPSGSGKTTLIKELIRAFSDEFEECISLTTRPRRGPEDDKFYRFITPDKLREKQEAGKLIQQVEYAGNFYANDRDLTDRQLKRSHCVMALTEQGVKNFIDAGYDVIVIRILPRGYEATSDEQRLQADQDRAKMSIPVHIEILNSFAPGGLESATVELKRLIKRIISPPQHPAT